MFNPTDPFVTSGPFNLTDFEVGEFFEFSANPDFCYYPEENTTSSTWPTNNGTSFNTSLAIAAGAVGAAATILVGGFLLFRKEMS